MTYTLELPETSESKALVSYLKALKNVRLKKNVRKIWTEKEIIKAVRIAEKGKKIPLDDAIKTINSW